MITLRGTTRKPKFTNRNVGYRMNPITGAFKRNEFEKAAKPGEYIEFAPGAFRKFSGAKPSKVLVSNLKKTASSGSKRTEIQAPKQQVRFYKKDDGIGIAMSPSARASFIRGKNKDYKIKTTPSGATYGVRQIV